MTDGFIGKRYYKVAISKDWDGWDVGLLSIKVIKNSVSNRKALRIVFWRLAAWVEL